MAHMNAPQLEIYLMGTPRVLLNGEPLRTLSRMAEALLYHLVLEPRPHRRESLADIFWPRLAQSAARHNVAKTVSEVNVALRSTAAQGEEGGPAINHDPEFIEFCSNRVHTRVDVLEFLSIVDGCRSQPLGPQQRDVLIRAAAMIGEGFLVGFEPNTVNSRTTKRGHDPVDERSDTEAQPEQERGHTFSTWRSVWTARIERYQSEIVQWLAIYDAGHRQYEAAQSWLQSCLELMPEQIAVHDYAMLLHCAYGHPERAQQCLEECCDLPREASDDPVHRRWMQAFDTRKTSTDLTPERLMDILQAVSGSAVASSQITLAWAVERIVAGIGVDPLPDPSAELSDALNRAEGIARQVHMSYVGQPHLFLALERDPALVIMLRRAEVSPADAVSRVWKALPVGTYTPPVDLKLTPNARICLDRATQLAARAGDPTVEPRHLVTALLEQRGTDLVRFLDRLGARWAANPRVRGGR